MPTVQLTLEENKRRECEALGIEYIPQSVLEKRERAAQAAEAEENRIRELREKCARKGLDFEAENQKVLAVRAEKKAKAELKAARRKKRHGEKGHTRKQSDEEVTSYNIGWAAERCCPPRYRQCEEGLQ